MISVQLNDSEWIDIETPPKRRKIAEAEEIFRDLFTPPLTPIDDESQIFEAVPIRQPDKDIETVENQFVRFAIQQNFFEKFILNDTNMPRMEKLIGFLQSAIKHQDKEIYKAVFNFIRFRTYEFDSELLFDFVKAAAGSFNNPELCFFRFVFKLDDLELQSVYFDNFDTDKFYKGLRKLADKQDLLDKEPKCHFVFNLAKHGFEAADVPHLTSMLKYIHTGELEISKESLIPSLKFIDLFNIHGCLFSNFKSLVFSFISQNFKDDVEGSLNIVRFCAISKKFDEDLFVGKLLNRVEDQIDEKFLKAILEKERCPKFVATLLYNSSKLSHDWPRANLILDWCLEKGLVDEKIPKKLRDFFEEKYDDPSGDFNIVFEEDCRIKVHRKILCFFGSYFRTLFCSSSFMVKDEVDFRKLLSFDSPQFPYSKIGAYKIIHQCYFRSGFFRDIPAIGTINEVVYEPRRNLLRYMNFLGMNFLIEELYNTFFTRLKKSGLGGEEDFILFTINELEDYYNWILAILEVYTPKEDNDFFKINLKILISHLAVQKKEELDELLKDEHPWVVYLRKYADQVVTLEIERDVEPYFIDFWHKIYPNLKKLSLASLSLPLIEAAKKFEKLKKIVSSTHKKCFINMK